MASFKKRASKALKANTKAHKKLPQPKPLPEGWMQYDDYVYGDEYYDGEMEIAYAKMQELTFDELMALPDPQPEPYSAQLKSWKYKRHSERQSQE